MARSGMIAPAITTLNLKDFCTFCTWRFLRCMNWIRDVVRSCPHKVRAEIFAA
jgi:hypothetical protein